MMNTPDRAQKPFILFYIELTRSDPMYQFSPPISLPRKDFGYKS